MSIDRRGKITRAECVVLILIAAAIIGGVYALSGQAQVGPQTWAFFNYYPSPWGEYNNLAFRRFVDYSNELYGLNPSGASRFNHLTIQYSAGMTYAHGGWTTAGQIQSVAGAQGPQGTQYIDLDSATTSMKVYTMRTFDRIVMSGSDVGASKLIYDIAEGMPCMDTVEAGDVVRVDESSGKLRTSRQAYDPFIAGVISAEPKVYLCPGEGKQPLALSGVVLCKASAENGAIAPGDVLVSASVAGHAMRASVDCIEPGMVVGKALAPLVTGEGKIKILVNKQ